MSETPDDLDLWASMVTLAKGNNLRPIDVARALNMQAGHLKRCLRGNPSLTKLREVAWALGCKPHFLLMPPEEIERWIKGHILRYEAFTVAHKAKAHAMEYTQAKDARRSRAKVGGNRTPAREELLDVYPSQALAPEIMDTNYVNYASTPPVSGVADREQRRKELSVGLPDHLVMADIAVERGYSYAQYRDNEWTLEALASQGLIVSKAQIKDAL